MDLSHPRNGKRPGGMRLKITHICSNPKSFVLMKQADEETWRLNQLKWQAAKEYCNTNNWSFAIITEQELYEGKECIYFKLL